jgi:hypothetical protein
VVGLQKKMQTLRASLDGEEHRAETAEDIVKELEQKYKEEWEQKYNETPISQHPDQNKKKRKVNESYNPVMGYEQVLTSEAPMEEVRHEKVQKKV